MKFTVTADTDTGIFKTINQDSILVKHAMTDYDEVLLAVICDGMGGLSKGELASAAVVREFNKWFDEELPAEAGHTDMQVIGGKWMLMLKELNTRISEYSKSHGLEGAGTTCSAILIIEDQYVIGHVGDTRIYQMGSHITQMTADQTFVAREVSRGTMSAEQAKKDKRRNLLLQCIGASKGVDPQIIFGKADEGTYLLCSDGFYHQVTEEEMYEFLNPGKLINKKAMHNNSRYLIDEAKSRGERDNLSVILVKTE